ncbi:hypothetical protein R5R35_005891 [Gryllus longicercus]|uniref:EndoU domain-containing protein n=1 Tax=Gryllus longicercus TaxID=2509291 RepID=A0AAN9VEW4_9ORTH
MATRTVTAVAACVLLVILLCSVAVYGATPGRVTDEALRNISETLLANDVNNAAQHVRVNYQSRTRSNSITDDAPSPFLSVGSRALEITTVAKVRRMFDNYIADTGINEQVTTQEVSEENGLLDAVIATSVMNHTLNFLATHGLVRRNTNALKSLLRELWFTMYSRGGGKMGSSAFEHVFLAELKRGEISGMHNWIFFSFEEARNTADYMGYIRKLELGNKGAIAKIHYKWSNVVKPVGSMFVGTSPELEMALYTICFLTRPDDRCQITLGNKVVTIRTHTFRYRGKNLIGSAFPEI